MSVKETDVADPSRVKMLIPYVLNFRLFIINNFPDLVKIYSSEAIRICDVLQARSKTWLSFALSGHEYAVVLSGLIRSRKKNLNPWATNTTGIVLEPRGQQ